ncbi:MAG: SDR family oxidoreductase [Deltaproteobacteria bacterium]|nr:MAG: SDR family oxidoreductase [Deltaproteobacteria bacterium]
MQTARWSRALVTGASSGIGEAIARRLAAEGVELVLVARRKQRLEQVGRELERSCPGGVEVIAADLTAVEDSRRVEARLGSADRPVDLLVNNVGGGRLSTFPEGPPEDEERWVRLNAIATLRLTAAALPRMRDRGRGTILNVSSGAALQPSPYAAVYGASKAFVNSFSQAIREENRRHGIVVTAVCPGFTDTDLPKRTGFDVQRVPRFLWMSADEVARRSLAAAAKGKAVYVPGMANKLGALLARYAPGTVVVPFVARSTLSFWRRERSVS